MTNAEKSRLMIEETLEMLRNKPINSSLVERWQLLDQATARYGDLPQPLAMGQALVYILERATLPVAPHDQLLGRFIDKVPSPEEEAFLQDLEQRDPVGRLMRTNIGHITLDWKHLLEYGIQGYVQRAEQALAQRRAAEADRQTLDFLEGMLLTYRAYQTYIRRYGEAAAAAGQSGLAAICANLAGQPPRTFHEALQLFLLVLNVSYVYAGAPVTCLCYGRLDDLLAPYYEADLASGRLTEEDAAYLIDDFNCKANLVLGRGEHQLSNGSAIDTGWFRNPVYDSPTYIVLGGYSNTRDHRTNPLTELFARRIQPRFENPVYIFRWTKDRPEAAWRAICDKLRQNASVLIYNDETVIPAMRHAGIEEADAVDYTMHPCNWPDVPSYGVVDTIGGPIPRMIMSALVDESGRLRRPYRSLDELYAAVAADFRALVRQRFAAYRQRFRSGVRIPPELLSITDCFTDGTIERANGILTGGAKYPAIYVLLRNIGTAADIMAALDTVAFQDEAALPALIEAMGQDFQSDAVLLERCRHAPKFGTDHDLADRHAQRLMGMLLDVLDEEAVNSQGERDVICLNVTITDMWHIQEGAAMGATPDGRRAQAPLSENLSPTVGAGRSVTALLNSVAKLPFERISSGALNVRIGRDLVREDAGLDRVIALMDGYFQSGGMQAQFNVTDTRELREAQQHPEDYKDLMVRITGYSAVFVDMCKSAQDEIIRRDELQ